MRAMLTDLAPHVVVVGSVARNELFPKDLDLLYNDSDVHYERIKRIINKHELVYGSSLPRHWAFDSYGFQVEVLPIHYGPSFRTCRKHATRREILGVSLWVAQPRHAPKDAKRSAR